MVKRFHTNNQQSVLFHVFRRRWPHIARCMVVLFGLLVFPKLEVTQESTPQQVPQEEAASEINEQESQKGAEDVPAVDEMTPELNSAVELGIAYLKKE